MKKLIKIFLWVITILVFTSLTMVKAENGSGSTNYTNDASNETIPTQDAYIAYRSISQLSNNDNTAITLKQPEDLYYDELHQKFYIADTGNKRIVVANKDFKESLIIGLGELDTPRGVYVDNNENVYVADYGKREIIIFEKQEDGYQINHIGKPNHPLYGEGTKFLPSKIVVDEFGTMYVVDSGNNNGLVTITKEGGFSGYFGANEITLSVKSLIKYLFSTKAQKKSLYSSPLAPVNLAIDNDGLINTITSSETSPIKKLNIAGLNLFDFEMYDSNTFVDICIGPTGTIYTVNSEGFIFEYDQEGNLLFVMGANDTTGKYLGILSEPHGIEVDDDYNLYLLDKNSIQVYYQTTFAELIHGALDLYYDGKYTESRLPWEKVLKMNNMFDLAHKGLGNSYLREGLYAKALSEFTLAKDVNGYSQAYWEVRNIWLTNNGTWLIIIFLLLIITIMVLGKLGIGAKLKNLIKNSKSKLIHGKYAKELQYYFRFIRHPLNGFYEIKHQETISVPIATFYYFIFFIIMIISNIWTGFVFNTKDIELLSIFKILVSSIGPLLLFVIVEYLISSITEGNAKIKNIYVGTICAFAPVVCFYPFVILLSNFIVLSESFLFTVPQIVLFGWSFILMYFMVKDVQDLQFGEANKNIILTILTMVLFIAFAFLLYVLSAQLVGFIKDLFIEVIAHG